MPVFTEGCVAPYGLRTFHLSKSSETPVKSVLLGHKKKTN
jgi:hypothetical protein